MHFVGAHFFLRTFCCLHRFKFIHAIRCCVYLRLSFIRRFFAHNRITVQVVKTTIQPKNWAHILHMYIYFLIICRFYDTIYMLLNTIFVDNTQKNNISICVWSCWFSFCNAISFFFLCAIIHCGNIMSNKESFWLNLFAFVINLFFLYCY